MYDLIQLCHQIQLYYIGSSDQNYHGYFEHTIMDLLTKTPKELRLWFAKVKLAREITGTDKPDQFSSDGALRQWVGLPNKQRIS